MKTFRLIGMALVAMCLCMNFASCSNEEVISVDPQGEKYVTVGLGCAGEFLEFSDSPLSRTATEELYGIQVYEWADIEKEDVSGNTYIEPGYTPYAHGMFTSLNDVKIKLAIGNKYKFEVSIVVDPFKFEDWGDSYKDWWFNMHYNEYYEKFKTEFAYTSSVISLCDIKMMSYGGTQYTQHKYDRYYGELEGYIPEENDLIEIETKRIVYGVRYETIDLEDNESLIVTIGRDDHPVLYSVELSSEPNTNIYTFTDIWDAWKGIEIWNETKAGYEYVNYANDKKLTINWNKADGTTVPMGTYNVTFKRNVMTTIRIKAENMKMDNGITVLKEEVSMVDDENIYEITGGTITEVPVTNGN